MAGIPRSRTGTLAAVASSDRVRARALAAEAGDPGNVTAYGDYAALLADPGVDAVYIATRHPQHARLITACAQAGKHVLCEKPLTVTGAEAASAAAAAARAGVVLVEAMMYRFQPQTERIRAAIADGLIGTVLHVDVSCAFATGFDPADRLFDPSAAGGAILDVGCYAMSFARMVASKLDGGDDDAVEAKPEAHRRRAPEAPPGLTTGPSYSLVFPGGLTASVRTGNPARGQLSGVHLRLGGPPAHPPTRGHRERRGTAPRVEPQPRRRGRPGCCPASLAAALFGAEIDALWAARDRAARLQRCHVTSRTASRRCAVSIAGAGPWRRQHDGTGSSAWTSARRAPRR